MKLKSLFVAICFIPSLGFSQIVHNVNVPKPDSLPTVAPPAPPQIKSTLSSAASHAASAQATGMNTVTPNTNQSISMVQTGQGAYSNAASKVDTARQTIETKAANVSTPPISQSAIDVLTNANQSDQTISQLLVQ